MFLEKAMRTSSNRGLLERPCLKLGVEKQPLPLQSVCRFGISLEVLPVLLHWPGCIAITLRAAASPGMRSLLEALSCLAWASS